MRREQNVNLSGDYQRITKLNKHYIKNEIYFHPFLTPTLLSQVRMHLPNLSEFSLEDDRAVFISPVLIGEPLGARSDLSSTTKVDIITRYLDIIQDFESLPLFMQLNLVRAENFYLVDGELMHRGVLIIEDVDFYQPLSFHNLLKAISRFVLELIDRDINLFNFKNFFRDLPYNREITSLSQVAEIHREIAINDLLVEEVFEPQEEYVVETNHWRYLNFKFVSIFVAFLLLFGTASYAMIQAVNIRDTQTLQALFKIEKRDQHYLVLDRSYASYDSGIQERRWEVYHGTQLLKKFDTENINVYFNEPGTYTIKLSVKDNQGNWSKIYSQDIVHSNEEPRVDELDAMNWKGASFDEETFYEGYRSIQIRRGNAKISSKDLYLANLIHLEFYSHAQSSEPLQIHIKGYREGALVGEHHQSITVEAGQWKKHSIQWMSELFDSIEIEFSDFDNNFHIDQLKLFSSQ